jgi:membrane protease subunit HflK
MEQNGTYQWVPDKEPKKPVKPVSGKKVGQILLFSLLVALVILGAMTSFYTVDDKQQAVVTTFGKVTDITEPGLHFKMPFGIQQAHHVDVNVYQ